jgi:hypothetical protein
LLGTYPEFVLDKWVKSVQFLTLSRDTSPESRGGERDQLSLSRHWAMPTQRHTGALTAARHERYLLLIALDHNASRCFYSG